MLSVLRCAVLFAHEAIKNLAESGRHFTLEEKLLSLFFIVRGFFLKIFYVLIAIASYGCRKPPSYHSIPATKYFLNLALSSIYPDFPHSGKNSEQHVLVIIFNYLLHIDEVNGCGGCGSEGQFRLFYCDFSAVSSSQQVSSPDYRGRW